MAYRLTKAEQETTISYNAAEKTAFINTANPKDIRKLDKLAADFPTVYKCTKVDSSFPAKEYEIADRRYVRFTRPRLYHSNCPNKRIPSASDIVAG